MKKQSYFLALYFLLALTLVLSACSEEAVETLVSEEEAAEVVTNAVAADVEGMIAEIEEATEMAEAYAYSTYCGMAFDSTLTHADNSGIRTYDYMVSWDWALSCNSLNIPETLTYSAASTGSYEVPRMSSSDGGTHNFTIGGLNLSSTEFIYNGTYSRSGTQQSNINTQSSFTSNLQVTASHVTIDKTTRTITSGTAPITLTGSGSGGTTFTYPGTLVFNGNQSATLTINGNTYQIQW